MEDLAVLDTPIPLVIGDTWDWNLVFWDDPDKQNSYDLTGKTVAAQIRWAGGSRDASISIQDAVAGQIIMSLTKEDTAGIPLGSLSSLFVEVTDGAAVRQTWFRAPIEAKEGF